MRERRLNRKKDKREKLLGELKQLEKTEKNEKAKGKLLTKVKKLEDKIAKAEAEKKETATKVKS